MTIARLCLVTPRLEHAGRRNGASVSMRRAKKTRRARPGTSRSRCDDDDDDATRRDLFLFTMDLVTIEGKTRLTRLCGVRVTRARERVGVR